MPVSNEHLAETHRVWDGLSFRMMPRKEARALVKDGVAQIADNLQASELKSVEQFNAAREAKAEKQTVQTKVELPPGAEPAKPKTRKKRTYNTRQMKAEK